MTDPQTPTTPVVGDEDSTVFDLDPADEPTVEFTPAHPVPDETPAPPRPTAPDPQ